MSKQEAEATRGGDYYFTENGAELGKVGEGDSIRVVLSSSAVATNFESFKNAGESWLNSPQGGFCQSFASTSVNVQREILSNMAYKYGGHSVALFTNPGNSNLLGHCEPYINESGNYVTSIISLNTAGTGYNLGNYHDLSLIIYHETVHAFQNAAGLLFADKNVKEYLAYLAVAQNPEFQYASEDHRQSVLGNLKIFAHSAGVTDIPDHY